MQGRKKGCEKGGGSAERPPKSNHAASRQPGRAPETPRGSRRRSVPPPTIRRRRPAAATAADKSISREANSEAVSQVPANPQTSKEGGRREDSQQGGSTVGDASEALPASSKPQQSKEERHARFEERLQVLLSLVGPSLLPAAASLDSSAITRPTKEKPVSLHLNSK